MSTILPIPSFIRKIAILALLSLLGVAPAASAASAEQMPNYDHWSQLPNDSLNRMAGRFLDRQCNPDSALLCYTIVANRYYTYRPKGEALHEIIRAMNNLGYLYAFLYFNYEKAYAYPAMALKISKEQGYKGSLPYIYQNLANIYAIQNDLDYNHPNGKAIIANYRKAFYAALAIRDDRILTIILNNLLGTAIDYGFLDQCRREISIYSRLRIPARTPLRAYTKSLCAAAQEGSHNHWQKAADIMGRALIDATPDTRQRTELFHAYTVAILFWRSGDHRGATRQLEYLIRKPFVQSQYDVRLEIYSLLYRISLEQGDKVSADRYLLSFFKTREAMMKATRVGGIERVKFLGQMREINGRVQLMAYRQRAYRLAVIIISLLSSVILLFAFLLYRKNRHLKELNTVLYQRIQEMLLTGEEAKAPQPSSAPESPEEATAGKREKYQNSRLNDQDKAEIMQRIEQVMANPRVICSETFSLGRLSTLTGYSYKVVSQVINERYGKNFNALLAERRICEACRKLNSPDTNSQYTVAAIAESVGYKSYSTFTAAFRKVTGLKPSEYIKIAAKQKKRDFLSSKS